MESLLSLKEMKTKNVKSSSRIKGEFATFRQNINAYQPYKFRYIHSIKYTVCNEPMFAENTTLQALNTKEPHEYPATS